MKIERRSRMSSLLDMLSVFNYFVFQVMKQKKINIIGQMYILTMHWCPLALFTKCGR